MNVEERILELGIKLPETTAPKGMYIPVKRAGGLLYVSGQLPVGEDGELLTGKIGGERDLGYGQEAARRCVIGILAALKNELGDLGLVKGVAKLQVFVNCEPDFTQQPLVGNGASELLFSIFGEPGRHARTSIGVNQLPLNASVEIDAIVDV